MVRSRSLIIAVVIQIVLGLFAAVSGIRILAAGIGGATPMPGGEELGGPPFWAGVMFLALAIAILFSAYGLWIGQKWGKIVALVTSVILTIFGLGDLVGAIAIGNYTFAALFAVYVALCITVVVLVLRRQPKPVMA
jgi:hypothetical protein